MSMTPEPETPVTSRVAAHNRAADHRPSAENSARIRAAPDARHSAGPPHARTRLTTESVPKGHASASSSQYEGVSGDGSNVYPFPTVTVAGT